MKRNRHLGVYACGNLAGCYDPDRQRAINVMLDCSDDLLRKADGRKNRVEVERWLAGKKILDRAAFYLAVGRLEQPGLSTREFDEEATPFAVERQQ